MASSARQPVKLTSLSSPGDGEEAKFAAAPDYALPKGLEEEAKTAVAGQ